MFKKESLPNMPAKQAWYGIPINLLTTQYFHKVCHHWIELAVGSCNSKLVKSKATISNVIPISLHHASHINSKFCFFYICICIIQYRKVILRKNNKKLKLYHVDRKELMKFLFKLLFSLPWLKVVTSQFFKEPPKICYSIINIFPFDE